MKLSLLNDKALLASLANELKLDDNHVQKNWEKISLNYKFKDNKLDELIKFLKKQRKNKAHPEINKILKKELIISV